MLLQIIVERWNIDVSGFAQDKQNSIDRWRISSTQQNGRRGMTKDFLRNGQPRVHVTRVMLGDVGALSQRRQ